MKKFIFILMLVLLSVSVAATSPSNFVLGDLVVVNQTKLDNMYYLSNSVSLLSDVKGDVYAVSSYFNSESVVDEDLSVLSGDADIYGVVGGDARIMSGDLFLGGFVFGDLVAFVSKYDSSKETHIGDNSYLNSDYVILKGKYDGDVYIKANVVYVDALVSGDLFVDSSRLDVANSSLLLGDVELTDNLDLNESLVEGGVSYVARKDWGENYKGISFSVGDWLLALATIFITGLAFLLIGRDYSMRVDVTLSRRPFYSFMLGLGTLILMPLVAIVLLMTVVGSILGFIVLALYVAMLLLSASIGAWYMGNLFLSMFNMAAYKYLKLGVGCVLFMFILLIPILGPLVVVVTSIIGLGAFFRNFYGRDKPKPKRRKNNASKKVVSKNSKKSGKTISKKKSGKSRGSKKK
ncbi:hypothetical protein K9L67_01410 [Candidatus Woesearchaeota archaeon]|nr:hypothetical protein [Candidatus Woesearchaeota archaeon]MCF7900862.1 hypothetical protein [Candidatus Woesearchaeota archaeon]MCF8014022.1 hypothetical protein [Candidatus Woesearchaeota archaeon]